MRGLFRRRAKALAEARLASLRPLVGRPAPEPRPSPPPAEAVCRVTVTGRDYRRALRRMVRVTPSMVAVPVYLASFALVVYVLAQGLLRAASRGELGAALLWTRALLALLFVLSGVVLIWAYPSRPAIARSGPMWEFFGHGPELRLDCPMGRLRAIFLKLPDPPPVEVVTYFDAAGVTCVTPGGSWRVGWDEATACVPVDAVVALVGARGPDNAGYTSLLGAPHWVGACVRDAAFAPAGRAGFESGGWGTVARLARSAGCRLRLPEPDGPDAPPPAEPRPAPLATLTRDPLRELPLGTVVLSRGGAAALALLGRGGPGGADYLACPWPVGLSGEESPTLLPVGSVGRVLALGAVDAEEAAAVEASLSSGGASPARHARPGRTRRSPARPPSRSPGVGSVVELADGRRVMVCGRDGTSLLACPWPGGWGPFGALRVAGGVRLRRRPSRAGAVARWRTSGCAGRPDRGWGRRKAPT